MRPGTGSISYSHLVAESAVNLVEPLWPLKTEFLSEFANAAWRLAAQGGLDLVSHLVR